MVAAAARGCGSGAWLNKPMADWAARVIWPCGSRVVGGRGDHPADQTERIAQRTVVTQRPGVFDTELLGDQVGTGPFGRVMRVHCAASIRASRERTRVGRLPGPSPIQTWSVASSRTYAASSSRPLEISMQASVIRVAASSDWERTST